MNSPSSKGPDDATKDNVPTAPSYKPHRDDRHLTTTPPVTPHGNEHDYGGAFDGFTVSSDADSGL